MLSIFGCGAVDDVRDDVVVATKSQPDVNKSEVSTVDQNNKSASTDINNTKKQSSSFNYCSSVSCNSKYQPNDKEEVLLPAEVILLSLSKTIPDLLKCISTPPSQITKDTTKKERKVMKETAKKRTAALETLYNLTKKEHNRIPLVNNTEKWDVVGTLTNALLSSMENKTNETKGSKQSVDEDRRLICWTLNNLSVPYENKEIIALGEHSTKLLQSLIMVIQVNEPETYLCCICLMNLSYLADAIRPITFYVPSSYGAAPYSPTKRSRSETSESIEPRSSEICYQVLGNESSLIRVIEQMMLTNVPYLCKGQSKQSVQVEAIRWGCGFIRNITSTGDADTDDGNGDDDTLPDSNGRQGSISDDSIEEICLLLSQTEIPRLMVQFVSDSPRPVIQWSKDSLEDICLGSICNLAQWQPSQEALRKAGALKRLEKIEGLPGIHGYRSRAIRCSLGALPKHC